jgi:hypothetical protein
LRDDAGTNLAPHPAAVEAERLLTECEVRFTRRSGPGGQNRNKVETAVVLTHRPTGLTAEANERRSQAENRRVALHRLRLALARAVRRPAAPDAAPSPQWLARLRGGRIAVSPEHEDFPALLAEALDGLDAVDGDFRIAAGRLGCTPSQLVKLVKDDPPAFVAINAARRGRGQPPLR